MSTEMTAAKALEAVRNATIYHSKRYPMPTTLMPDGGGYFIDDAVFDGLVAALPALRAAVEERDALRSRVEQFETQTLHRIATHHGTPEADKALADRMKHYRMKQRLDERAKAKATIDGLAKETVALRTALAEAVEERDALRAVGLSLTSAWPSLLDKPAASAVAQVMEQTRQRQEAAMIDTLRSDLRAAVEERDKLEEVGNDVLDDLTIAQNANAALRSELASAEARAEEAERAGLEVCAATDEWVAANDALRSELARWRDAVREAFACDDGAPVEPADVARLVQACDVETRADLARMMAELQAKWDAALSPAAPQEGTT